MDEQPKLDPDQVRQILAALLEVMRSKSGYGRVEVRIDKGRAMFISRTFDDRCLPGRLRDETFGSD